MNTSTSIKSELPVKLLAHLKKIKTISRGDKYLSGTALYCTNNDDNIFREVMFREFLGTPDCLISSFEKNSIILLIGRYVYEGDAEYVSLVQTVPVSSSDNEYILTPPDLPHSSPLLLFSAPVMQGSYYPDSGSGRDSFMLSKHLYNGVTNSKQIPSNVIISSDIEWSYLASETQYSGTLNKDKSKSWEELDNQLDSIEEKYATLSS
ncbi:hypothetical protein F8M41_001169 [Gigaspora margarita]|uniref:Uncharacterized protein n=1 Tax=Gigaspora margarita TaxID=4874 RepID=A0A8H4A9G2_GIGMA|nr:hypothetical protein F8M41_001169 [Gigaspora margarita]